MKNTYYKITKDLGVEELKNIGKRYRISLWLNAILIVIILLLTLKPQNIIIRHRHTRDTIQLGDVQLNDSSLTTELHKQGCILPNVALAQAKLETGNYKSIVCLSNRNLFGIKFHKCNYVLGKLNNHASYKSYKDNIKCYIHVQNRYLRNIDGKYAEAPNYISKLQTIK